MSTENEKIDCMKCQYFYITWDQKFPRGCKLLNFKSKQMPSIEVLQSSGSACLKFGPKIR